MNRKSDLLRSRFLLNMQRISRLVTLVYSDVDALKPIGFLQYKGASADILRAVIVFLHATFEDALRCQGPHSNKTYSFYSGVDIDKALKRAGLDTKPFSHLYPPLTQMAKRRNRIVHNADLSDDGTVLDAWNVVDHWQLILWNLAVLAFYYEVLVVTQTANAVQSKRHEQTGKAISAHIAFGNQLVAFAKTPPELKIEALRKCAETAATIGALLKIEM
jgi:hypothetical protein